MAGCKMNNQIRYTMFRIYSPTQSAMRAAGYAVTEFAARGRDGTITVVNSAVTRKDIPAVRELVEHMTRRLLSRRTRCARCDTGISGASFASDSSGNAKGSGSTPEP
jgi:hypothetical protein